jgi:outer membrane immunogenic protein
MRKYLLGSLALAVLIGGPATAADLPVKTPVYKAPPPVVIYNWTGCYVGGNVGGHWGKDSITSTTDPVGWFASGAAFIDGFSPTSYRPQGVIGGVQAGCNWQVNSFLVGIEGDADWLGGTASRTIVNTNNLAIALGDFMTNSTNATFLSTARARLGGTFDRVLLYVTGGVAFGTVKTTDSFGAVAGTSVATTTNTTTRTGWTVGGGLEYAFADNWTAKAEYLYVDLGSFDASIPSCAICAPGSDITIHHKYTDNIVRAGLNYKLGGPVAAKY